FRDPAGTLQFEGHAVKRRVKPEAAKASLRFLRSPLAQQWISDGKLIATAEVEAGPDEVVLEHPRVFFPSYPWEWTPEAWVAAGELTLDLCDALLGEGLILKDATPLNVLFEGARPVFVDVLSIDARDPQSPLWLAYAQFVRTFLLPLAAYRYLGWPLAASIQKRDGYEPGDLYPHLSAAQRWRAPFRSLVTLPYLFEKRSKPSGAAAATTRLRQTPEVATAVLRRNLKRLRVQLRKLMPDGRDSRWSKYPENAGHYTGEDHSRKQGFVREPLLADPARPSPAVGWRNREWLSLLDRAQGRFDCVMMLGLIHHLLIADQIPLSEVVALARDLTTRWAIVEWVPATDPRFAELVRGRDDLYGHLDEALFLAAIQPHFTIAAQERLKNGRALFLLEAI